MLMLRQISAMMPDVPYFSLVAIAYGNKILWIGILLLAIVIICNRTNLLEIVACLWAAVTVYISDNTMMLILVFLLIAARNINIDKECIVKAWMVPVTIVILLSVGVYSVLHMQGNPLAIEYDGRWTFFFGHPNGFGLWFTFWILGIIYLGRKRMSCWFAVLVLFIATVFLAIVPQNKTSAIVLALGMPLLVLEKYWWKVCKIVLYAIPVLCILVTFFLTTLYYQGILLCNQYVLQRTFSMRFQDAAINLKECPLNMWGQKVYHLGQDMVLHGVIRRDVSMDNGIVTALIYFGLILGTLLVTFFVISIFLQAKTEDERHRLQAILLAITFVMGMMEWPAWYGTIGFPMFFLLDWIKNNDKKKSEIT